MKDKKWKRVRLEPHVKIRSGDSPSMHTLSPTDGVPFVKVEDLNNCRKYQVSGREFITSDVTPIPRGSVIFPKRGAAIMNNKIRLTDAPLCLDTNMMALTVTSDELESEFLFYTLGHAKLYRIADTSTIPQLNNKHINPFRIALPPLPEQQKIAAILSTWDRAIELTEKLIAATQKRKQALMQQLLTCKEVKPVALSSFLKPTKYPVPKPDKAYTALGIRSHCKGTFQRSVENPDSVAMDTLYEVKQSELIVNITFAWEGAIAVVKPEDEGCLVSHRFPTYAVDSKKANMDFVRHLVTMPSFIFQLGFISPGGAGRNRVLSKTDFLKLKLKLPPVNDQIRIAQILKDAEHEVALLAKRLYALNQQKKGLMQQLLTGKVRVNVGAETIKG